MKRPEVWIFLFIIGILAFNWPFLDIFSISLPEYLFSFWLVFITLLFIFIRVIGRKERGV